MDGTASEAFRALQEQLAQPLNRVSLIAQVGLSFKQYQTPRLLPSFASVRLCWRSAIASIPGLRSIRHCGHAATIWPVEHIINYVFSSPFILSFFVYGTRLDLIRRLDEYPQAGCGVFVESYSFRNFGVLCKCLLFQFVSTITTCTSHTGHLESLLRFNNDFLSSCLSRRSVTIQPANQQHFDLPFTLRIGGDDPMLRFLLRRGPSSSDFCCLYCFWLRGGPASQDAACLRGAAMRLACAHLPGAGGYADPACTDPMVAGLQPFDVVFCILHALARIGDLLNTLLALYGIHLAMSAAIKPAQGWHLKGCHAALLLKAFGPIGEALGLDPEILACVADVRRIFHVLYFFDPLAPEHAADLAWFKASVEAVMDSFARLVARGHVTNYIHQIQKHAAPLLECGGLAPFANDTHETLQCLLKQAYHNFSSRGGQGLDKTLRLVCERWMMRLHVLVLAGYRHDSHIPGLTAQQRVSL